MKKLITSMFFCAVLSVMLLVPVNAEDNAVRSDVTHNTTYNRAVDGTAVAPGVNTYGTNRAIAPGVNTYTTPTTTNYRARAVNTTPNRYGWGWLGLLGLIGLAGLRGRNRERA